MSSVTIARDVIRRPVTVDVDGKIMVLIAGQSGCGKSELNKTLCLEAAKKLSCLLFHRKLEITLILGLL